MVTECIVQLLTGAPSHRAGINMERRCAGSMEPQAQFANTGDIKSGDSKICPCSWSIEDDPSPEAAHSSIDRRCPPFQSGVFLEYYLQYLGWKNLVYDK